MSFYPTQLSAVGRLVLAVLIVLALAPGCASTGMTVVRPGSPSKPPAAQDRLVPLAWRLFHAAADFCPFAVDPTYGFNLASKSGPRQHDLSDNTLIVQAVYPGLPAHAAGVPVGGALLGLDGQSIGHLTVEEVLGRIRRSAMAKIEPISLFVEYAGKGKEYHLTSVPACQYEVRFIDGDTVNAYSDGRLITVTRGVTDFVAGEDELVFVLAHEIAHNALQHVETIKLNRVLRNFVNAAASNVDSERRLWRPKDIELEADRLALLIMARAGYDARAAIALVERLGSLAAGVASRQYSESHPSTEERIQGLYLTLSAMASGQEAGPSDPPQ